MRVILASQSPRRKELLSRLIDDFDIMPADIDESGKDQYPPVEYVERMAEQKSAQIAKEYPDALVIGCDTVVIKDHKIFGKPASREEAFQMLKSLSNATHKVCTAVAIRRKDKLEQALTYADVTFYPLTDEEINSYLDMGEYADKAGAYGIQGKAGVFVKAIQGDYYCIVGFPVGKVHQMLKHFE